MEKLTAPSNPVDERKNSVVMDDDLGEIIGYIKNCKDKKKLDYIREVIYAHESELRADEMLKSKPKNKLTDKPMVYEDDDE